MKQEYIIGDVVEYDNKVMVVKEPRDGSHFDLSSPKEGLVYCCVGVDDMKSVKLTPAILDKNGWKKGKPYYHFDLHDGYRELCAFLYEDEVFSILVNDYTEDCGIVIADNIRSVSDLQHLLFGLRLNSKMDV